MPKIFPASKALGEIIDKELTGIKENYGVVIKNLKTGEYYTSGEKSTYEAASLYKLWVMATAYEQIKNGSLREDEVLSQDVEVLNEKFGISSESAELTQGTITLSVADSLYKMITISDNYAALLLTEKVRLSSVASFLEKNGFSESHVDVEGAPITTAYDIALFFEKLYRGEIIDSQYSAKMLSLLKEQKLNNKIPKYLPQGTIIAHKTGELGEYTHDAGIVYVDKGDYIIVVLSKTKDPSLAEEKISDISASSYNYFLD